MIELYAIRREGNGLAPVVGPVADDGEVTPQSLWRHEEVVEELMAQGDVLPVRYGTRFADEREATEAIAERRASLLAALDHVSGAVELSVRALSADAEAIRAALAPLARDSAEREPKQEGEVLRAAYLVDRDGVERFVARVAQLQSDQPGAQILCTGPWPPYSFSERS